MFLILHLSILLKIIPYTMVWGSRLKSGKQMFVFEIISILVTTLFLVIILVQAKILIINAPNIVITYGLWIMAVLFLINTIGNAFSKNKIEQRVFTPVTIILVIFSSILALSNGN
jgi:hypothetical protein